MWLGVSLSVVVGCSLGTIWWSQTLSMLVKVWWLCLVASSSLTQYAAMWSNKIAILISSWLWCRKTVQVPFRTITAVKTAKKSQLKPLFLVRVHHLWKFLMPNYHGLRVSNSFLYLGFKARIINTFTVWHKRKNLWYVYGLKRSMVVVALFTYWVPMIESLRNVSKAVFLRIIINYGRI